MVDDDHVPMGALEPTLKLDPVQVACDAGEQMTARERKQFNTWCLDHGDAVTVPIEHGNE